MEGVGLPVIPRCPEALCFSSVRTQPGTPPSASEAGPRPPLAAAQNKRLVCGNQYQGYIHTHTH